MKHILLSCALVSLCALAACADDPGDTNPVEYDEASLNERGPYIVGFQRTTLTYDAPGEDAPRELPLFVWYPADDAAGAKRTTLELLDLFPLKGARSFNKPPLADLDARPFAIYSHGSGGQAALGYPTAEQFATRGWIVAAVDHTGNTIADMAGSSPRATVEISVLRPLDIREVLDAAEDGFGFEGFDGKVDTAQSFIFGHSFGGFTSLVLGGATFDKSAATARACDDDPASDACAFLSDPEVVAAIDAGFEEPRIGAIGLQAPAMMGVLDPANINVPTLMLSADRDKTTTHERATVPIWEGLNNPADLWVRIADAGHFSFITICDEIGVEAISAFQPNATEDGCGEDFVAPLDIAKISTAYLVSFAEKNILGIDAWTPYATGKQHFEVEGDADIQHVVHAP